MGAGRVPPPRSTTSGVGRRVPGEGGTGFGVRGGVGGAGSATGCRLPRGMLVDGGGVTGGV